MGKKSLLQQNKHCYVCGYDGKCHEHHIFYGTANRKKSDEDGMIVYLCPAHHNMSSVGIHFNHDLDVKIKQQAEKIWINTYAKDCNTYDEKIAKFIKRYGHNYIDY